MKWLASLCVLANFVLSACIAEPPVVHLDEDRDRGQSLEAALLGGGLDEPHALSGLLGERGLYFMEDVRQLNEPEQLELADSLAAAGVNLGSRSKLRLLADGASACVEPGDGPMAVSGADEASVRRVQDAPTAAKSGGGFSVETLAIAVTGFLGMASYILQAKLARCAPRLVSFALF
jgi:hypothetical protein